jgi:hypothetical protein
MRRHSNDQYHRPLGGLADRASRIALDLRCDRHAGNQCLAAPGGYVLVTRGMYELADSDEELAGVLAHEINHVVQRDHYTVIRQQELQEAGKDLVSGQVTTGGGIAGSMARSYVEKHGATIMMTGLDREAEYRSTKSRRSTWRGRA